MPVVETQVTACYVNGATSPVAPAARMDRSARQRQRVEPEIPVMPGSHSGRHDLVMKSRTFYYRTENFQVRIRPHRNVPALPFPFAGQARSGHTMSCAVHTGQLRSAHASTHAAGLSAARAFFSPAPEDTRLA
jgi:hypothetical protein